MEWLIIAIVVFVTACLAVARFVSVALDGQEHGRDREP